MCAVVDVGWSQDVARLNSHQIYVRVVPPEDGQVMPETCTDHEPQ
jgi:hypothetical protein